MTNNQFLTSPLMRRLLALRLFRSLYTSFKFNQQTTPISTIVANSYRSFAHQNSHAQCSNRPMPHLLFVVNDTGFFLSHRLPIAKAAIARGYKVYLAARNTGGINLIEGAGIVFLPMFLDRAGRNPAADFYYVVQLAYRILKIKPDIIH